MAATLVDIVGLREAGDRFQAPSLLPVLHGKAKPKGPVFFELDSAPTFSVDVAENARLEGLVTPALEVDPRPGHG